MLMHGSGLTTWDVSPKNTMGIPDTFAMAWVVNNADLTDDHLVAAKGGPKAAHNIMISMAQLPETSKIEEELVHAP
eukprot:4743883-Pyramimonas_sp.AAC.1